MTDFWTRASIIGLAGAALAACATPQYPTAEGQPPRAPLVAPTPNFPIVQGAPATTTTAEAAPTAAPGGGTVQSQALPPVTTASAPTSVTSQPLTPIPTTSTQPSQLVTTTRTVPVAAGAVVDAEGKPTTYEVQPGDTLYAIARKLGTTTTRLAEDNNLSSPYPLTPGQTLKGPAPKTKAYTVMAGDTLFAIARRFSVRAQDIAQANEIALATPINVGQRLLLPAGYRDIGPSTRTITSTQPRFDPPPQVPVSQPTTTTTTVTAPVTTVASISTTPTPVTAKPYTPPATTVTPALPSAPRPYTPPPGATVTPKPYTPPPGTTTTTVTRPYTPPATTTAPMIATGLPPTDTEVAAAGLGRFVWPVRGDVVSPFGPKGGGQRNDGLNIRATAGTQVQAAAAGEVVYAGDQVPGFGNLVLVKHDGGWVTAYAHLSRIDVKMRDRVVQGQALGQVGSTGGVPEPQLHFEVRYAPSPKDKARPVDPSLVLPG
jgi:murein DD-endopeptidase MepM/ murein hydrolase activator NlpD